MKRKEIAVKNQPGIYKVFFFDEEKQKWIDSGSYRAIRRSVRDGKSVKEQAKFSSFDEAKLFRTGFLNKSASSGVHRNEPDSDEGLTFEKLVQNWKEFHFLRIDQSTREFYERRLPHLDCLNPVLVETINPKRIDELVKYWVLNYPKRKDRKNFDKELDLLKVILNFYRRRMDAKFVLPIFDEHYKAARISGEANQPVRSLAKSDIGPFFQTLRAHRNPIYYPLALTQFCLGLRIGEVCGLHWKDIDFKNRVVKIVSTITWSHNSHEPTLKLRPKNGRARFLGMPEALAKELETWKKWSDPKVELVFHDSGQPLIRKTIGENYNRALQVIGVTYVSGTHILRKTAATQANRVTGDFFAVSKLLDHATPDVTMRYVEEVDDQKRKVAKALDDVFDELISSKAAPINRLD